MRRSAATTETWIGVAGTAVAIGAMAIDHLVGNDPDADDAFPVDPAAFFVSSAITIVLAVVLFARVVPASRDPERAANRAIVCSSLAVLTVFALFLGFPIVLAAAGIALGLIGRAGSRRTLATAAVVVGAAFVALTAIAFAASALGS
jgi:hypothetical protein